LGDVVDQTVFDGRFIGCVGCRDQRHRQPARLRCRVGAVAIKPVDNDHVGVGGNREVVELTGPCCVGGYLKADHGALPYLNPGRCCGDGDPTPEVQPYGN
jgi:hypothetical protein